MYGMSSARDYLEWNGREENATKMLIDWVIWLIFDGVKPIESFDWAYFVMVRMSVCYVKADMEEKY